MAAAGPNYPSTIVEDTSDGSLSWSGLANLAVDDGSYASTGTSFFPSSGESYYAKCTGYGFSLPSGATIDGIEITAQSGGSGEWRSVKAVKGGTIAGDDLVASPIPIGAEQVHTFGSPSELCGLVWAASDVNNSGFGAAIQTGFLSMFSTAYIDYVFATVYYTAPIATAPVDVLNWRRRQLGAR